MNVDSSPPFRCVLEAWSAHERELHAFVVSQAHDPALADDLLQEVFLRAMRAGEGFCRLDSPRAWLFQVARHALIDTYRLRKRTIPVADSLPAPSPPLHAPVDALADCLERALQSLDHDDREVLRACDLNGATQRAYADAHGLSLVAVKARIQRARVRLRQHLVERCGIRFDAGGHVCCHRGAP